MDLFLFAEIRQMKTYTHVGNDFVFTVAGLVVDTYTVRWVTTDTVQNFRLVVNHN